MTRLIDADALMVGVTNVMPCNDLNVDCGFCQFYDKEERLCLLEKWIDNAPTIDAVEVVRCGNCKRRKKNKFCLEYNRYEKDDTGYCSYGERKTE